MQWRGGQTRLAHLVHKVELSCKDRMAHLVMVLGLATPWHLENDVPDVSWANVILLTHGVNVYAQDINERDGAETYLGLTVKLKLVHTETIAPILVWYWWNWLSWCRSSHPGSVAGQGCSWHTQGHWYTHCIVLESCAGQRAGTGLHNVLSSKWC